MSDEQLDREIYEALLRMGWLIPTTAEEIEIMETVMANQPPVDFPEILRRPPIERLAE